jgi:FkbM family methyltransferase
VSVFEQVINRVVQNAQNNYLDNYDEQRFGPKRANRSFLKEKLKELLFKNRVHIAEVHNYLDRLNELRKYEVGLELMYQTLADEQSRKLLIDLVAFKILGSSHFKLKTNTPENWKKFEEVKKLADKSDSIDPNFKHFILYKFDLTSLDWDIRLYFTATGVLIDFLLEQYRYSHCKTEITALPGETVIDAGGCWGDTALYFSDRVGPTGKVYSFEFIPNNIDIFEKNLELNPRLKDNIELIPQPLWNISDQQVYYEDNGPGSQVSFMPFENMSGATRTITIDDFVATNAISKVDFIKMDIEGAEENALEGARQVIMKYKPKLAIAIYHSDKQFIDVPKWILDLKLGYEIYIDHFTIHAEETVLFAKVP